MLKLSLSFIITLYYDCWYSSRVKFMHSVLTVFTSRRSYVRSRDSSVDIATRLLAGRPRTRGSILGSGKKLFSITSTVALSPTHHPIQWILGAVSPRVKQQGREADPSPPSGGEVKNGEAILSLPHASPWRGTHFYLVLCWPILLRQCLIHATDSNPSWFLWTFMVGYCREQLKRLGYSSHCVWSLWTGNTFNKFLRTSTLVHTSYVRFYWPSNLHGYSIFNILFNTLQN
jgi:hypothetical protein